jgi:hypothetical protein
MARIRYRWVLPVVALALYVGLIWFGCPYLQWARQRAQARPVNEWKGASHSTDFALSRRCSLRTAPVPAKNRSATACESPQR